MNIEHQPPTDQDLRSAAVYPASRLVEEQIKQGVHFPDPARQIVEYAEVIYIYFKEGIQ
jgi:hypothetical protein